MNPTATAIPLAVAIMLAVTAATAPATPAVTNMYYYTPSGGPLIANGGATSFTTGDAPATLTAVSAWFWNTSAFGFDATAGIYSDGGNGLAGTLLETLPRVRGPSGQNAFTFSSSGLALQPHTTYWFAPVFNTPTEWIGTTGTGEFSDYGWTIGDLALGAGPAGGTGLLQIDATILPEPATLSLAALTAPLLARRRRRH